MDSQIIPAFSIIGISVRTTNENGQAAKDIPELWNRFMTEGIAAKIPGKADDNIYCIYTDYEKDHTRPYTTILGCRVTGIAAVPEGMTGKTIAEAAYNKFTVTGNLQEGIVYNAWINIWNADLPRTFDADFEVYGAQAHNPENAMVDIFIGVSR